VAGNLFDVEKSKINKCTLRELTLSFFEAHIGNDCGDIRR
jgi:hypothetical protein